MAKARTIRFTCTAIKFFDTYGNTYHSVRITRCRDGKTISSGKSLVYGYGDQYRQTALKLMASVKWIPKRFRESDVRTTGGIGSWERLTNYPVLWNVSEGLKRDAVENGEL